MKQSDFSGIDLTFPLLSFEKALRLLRLLDFERADIALTGDPQGNHLCTYEELQEPYENGKKLLERIQQEGLKQTDLFVFMGDTRKTALNHPDKTVREDNAELFCKAVEYAHACECGHMTILPGVEFDGAYGTSLETASRELAWRVDCAAERGITLAVEAHIESIVDLPEKAINLLECTKGLTLTLDYSHFIRSGAAQEDIDRLIEYASHMHFRNAAKGSSQTIFAESEIDYRKVIYLLKEHQYSGGLTMEFCSHSWEDQNRVDTIGETIYLRKYLLDNWENV